MRNIFFLLVLASGFAHGAANDLLFTQRDATDTGTIPFWMPFPAGGADAIMVMNSATTLPNIATLSGGIIYDGTSLTTSAIPLANINGLTAALALKAAVSSLATVATSGDYNDLINKPTIITPSQAAASRSIGTTGWQASVTRNALVSYSVSIATALSLTTGSAGYVSLEIASNSGFSSNLQEVGRLTNAQTGTLTIGLALNQTIGGTLSGFVPAAYYARLKSTNTTGTPTYAYVAGQEVLL